jgi:hypothetical protein
VEEGAPHKQRRGTNGSPNQHGHTHYYIGLELLRFPILVSDLICRGVVAYPNKARMRLNFNWHKSALLGPVYYMYNAPLSLVDTHDRLECEPFGFEIKSK